MDTRTIEMGPLHGCHGSYTFYKSFRYRSQGHLRTVSMEKFFFVHVSKNSPLCIGEIQLIWTVKNDPQEPLCSVRLYFLPEQLPEGREPHHGEDEVVATEKMVLKVKDLMSWLVAEDVSWTAGSTIAFANNDSELSSQQRGCPVLIMSYPKYCRLMAVKKRLDYIASSVQSDDEAPLTAVFRAAFSTAGHLLCGMNAELSSGVRIMFCRSTFEHPELDDHEARCDHLAPNLKGRPRTKHRGTQRSISDPKLDVYVPLAAVSLKPKRGRPVKSAVSEAALRSETPFLKAVYGFMKDRGTPIHRIPSLGFKKIDLFIFYKTAEKLGGYKQICLKRLWKVLHDKIGGNPGSTSAATCTRRHYERLLLPFEEHVRKRESTSASAGPNSLPISCATSSPSLSCRSEKPKCLPAQQSNTPLSTSAQGIVTLPGTAEAVVASKEDLTKGTVVLSIKKEPAMLTALAVNEQQQCRGGQHHSMPLPSSPSSVDVKIHDSRQLTQRHITNTSSRSTASNVDQHSLSAHHQSANAGNILQATFYGDAALPGSGAAVTSGKAFLCGRGDGVAAVVAPFHPPYAHQQRNKEAAYMLTSKLDQSLRLAVPYSPHRNGLLSAAHHGAGIRQVAKKPRLDTAAVPFSDAASKAVDCSSGAGDMPLDLTCKPSAKAMVLSPVPQSPLSLVTTKVLRGAHVSSSGGVTNPNASKTVVAVHSSAPVFVSPNTDEGKALHGRYAVSGQQAAVSGRQAASVSVKPDAHLPARKHSHRPASYLRMSGYGPRDYLSSLQQPEIHDPDAACSAGLDVIYIGGSRGTAAAGSAAAGPPATPLLQQPAMPLEMMSLQHKQYLLRPSPAQQYLAPCFDPKQP